VASKLQHPRIAWLLVFALLGSVAMGLACASEPILVGVLEDLDARDADLPPGMAIPHVRLAFKYRGGDWYSLSGEYPSPVKWTVVFDGRAIGKIRSQAGPYPAYLGGAVGIESITTPASAVPRIKLDASAFWYTEVRARNRPLLLVSAPHARDPDHWKPAALSVAEKQLAITAFREKVPRLEHCDQPEEQPIHQLRYSDAEIIFIKAYRSKSGEVLVGARLDDRRSNCEFFDDPVFFDYWFVLEGRVARFLDTQMVPMDAADLAATGSSVWVFQTSRGEDDDGYELFYDNFSKEVATGWSYH